MRTGCDKCTFMCTSAVNYKRHRFPPQMIAHAVWLYFRFPLSLRLVEELLLERGIAGRKRWLWRAADQDGYVLDEIVQNHRNTKAAGRLLTRLLKKQGIAPKRVITEKLRSYGAARRQVMPHVEHRSHKGLNNRAENSHVPLRKRERMMQGFRSPGGLQYFVFVFSAGRNLFVPPLSQRSAFQNRVHRIRVIAEWKVAAGAMT